MFQYHKILTQESEELQAEGKSQDLALFPLDRHIFMETPPIPGFREEQIKKSD